MKLAIYSDIHLERQPFVPGPRAIEADVVVLAGDIGEGTVGLDWARKSFPDKPIVAVLGNHEFFGGRDFNGFVEEAQRRADDLDIHLLECGEVSVGGVRFLGATLWTDFRLFAPDDQAFEDLKVDAQASIRDYAVGQIATRARTNEASWLLPADTIERHRLTRKWLQTALNDGNPLSTVVVTHHCPSVQSIPEQFRSGAASRFSPAYASDLSELCGRSSLWIHGHVHESADYELNGTRVICNPKGYSSPDLGPQNPAFDIVVVNV